MTLIEVGVKVGDNVLVTIPRYCEKQPGKLVHIFPRYKVPNPLDVVKYYGIESNRKSYSGISLDRYVVESAEDYFLIVPMHGNIIVEKGGSYSE